MKECIFNRLWQISLTQRYQVTQYSFYSNSTGICTYVREESIRQQIRKYTRISPKHRIVFNITKETTTAQDEMTRRPEAKKNVNKRMQSSKEEVNIETKRVRRGLRVIEKVHRDNNRTGRGR